MSSHFETIPGIRMRLRLRAGAGKGGASAHREFVAARSPKLGLPCVLCSMVGDTKGGGRANVTEGARKYRV